MFKNNNKINKYILCELVFYYILYKLRKKLITIILSSFLKVEIKYKLKEMFQ